MRAQRAVKQLFRNLKRSSYLQEFHGTIPCPMDCRGDGWVNAMRKPMSKITFAVATIAALAFGGTALAGANDPAPVSAPQTNVAPKAAPSQKMIITRSHKRAALKHRKITHVAGRHDRGLHVGFSHSRHLGYAKAGKHDIKAGMKARVKVETKSRAQ